MNLFTAEWCTACTPVKKYIKDNNLDIRLVDVDTGEGSALAASKGIRGLPTLIGEGLYLTGSEAILKLLKEK